MASVSYHIANLLEKVRRGFLRRWKGFDREISGEITWRLLWFFVFVGREFCFCFCCHFVVRDITTVVFVVREIVLVKAGWISPPYHSHHHYYCHFSISHFSSRRFLCVVFPVTFLARALISVAIKSQMTI